MDLSAYLAAKSSSAPGASSRSRSRLPDPATYKAETPVSSHYGSPHSTKLGNFPAPLTPDIPIEKESPYGYRYPEIKAPRIPTKAATERRIIERNDTFVESEQTMIPPMRQPVDVRRSNLFHYSNGELRPAPHEIARQGNLLWKGTMQWRNVFAVISNTVNDEKMFQLYKDEQETRAFRSLDLRDCVDVRAIKDGSGAQYLQSDGSSGLAQFRVTWRTKDGSEETHYFAAADASEQKAWISTIKMLLRQRSNSWKAELPDFCLGGDEDPLARRRSRTSTRLNIDIPRSTSREDTFVDGVEPPFQANVPSKHLTPDAKFQSALSLQPEIHQNGSVEPTRTPSLSRRSSKHISELPNKISADLHHSLEGFRAILDSKTDHIVEIFTSACASKSANDDVAGKQAAAEIQTLTSSVDEIMTYFKGATNALARLVKESLELDRSTNAKVEQLLMKTEAQGSVKTEEDDDAQARLEGRFEALITDSLSKTETSLVERLSTIFANGAEDGTKANTIEDGRSQKLLELRARVDETLFSVSQTQHMISESAGKLLDAVTNYQHTAMKSIEEFSERNDEHHAQTSTALTSFSEMIGKLSLLSETPDLISLKSQASDLKNLLEDKIAGELVSLNDKHDALAKYLKKDEAARNQVAEEARRMLASVHYTVVELKNGILDDTEKDSSSLKAIVKRLQGIESTIGVWSSRMASNAEASLKIGEIYTLLKSLEEHKDDIGGQLDDHQKSMLQALEEKLDQEMKSCRKVLVGAVNEKMESARIEQQRALLSTLTERLSAERVEHQNALVKIAEDKLNQHTTHLVPSSHSDIGYSSSAESEAGLQYVSKRVSSTLSGSPRASTLSLPASPKHGMNHSTYSDTAKFLAMKANNTIDENRLRTIHQVVDSLSGRVDSISERLRDQFEDVTKRLDFIKKRWNNEETPAKMHEQLQDLHQAIHMIMMKIASWTGSPQSQSVAREENSAVSKDVQLLESVGAIRKSLDTQTREYAVHFGSIDRALSSIVPAVLSFKDVPQLSSAIDGAHGKLDAISAGLESLSDSVDMGDIRDVVAQQQSSLTEQLREIAHRQVQQFEQLADGQREMLERLIASQHSGETLSASSSRTNTSTSTPLNETVAVEVSTEAQADEDELTDDTSSEQSQPQIESSLQNLQTMLANVHSDVSKIKDQIGDHGVGCDRTGETLEMLSILQRAHAETVSVVDRLSQTTLETAVRKETAILSEQLRETTTKHYDALKSTISKEGLPLHASVDSQLGEMSRKMDEHIALQTAIAEGIQCSETRNMDDFVEIKASLAVMKSAVLDRSSAEIDHRSIELAKTASDLEKTTGSLTALVQQLIQNQSESSPTAACAYCGHSSIANDLSEAQHESSLDKAERIILESIEKGFLGVQASVADLRRMEATESNVSVTLQSEMEKGFQRNDAAIGGVSRTVENVEKLADSIHSTLVAFLPTDLHYFKPAVLEEKLNSVQSAMDDLRLQLRTAALSTAPNTAPSVSSYHSSASSVASRSAELTTARTSASDLAQFNASRSETKMQTEVLQTMLSTQEELATRTLENAASLDSIQNTLGRLVEYAVKASSKSGSAGSPAADVVDITELSAVKEMIQTVAGAMSEMRAREDTSAEVIRSLKQENERLEKEMAELKRAQEKVLEKWVAEQRESAERQGSSSAREDLRDSTKLPLLLFGPKEVELLKCEVNDLERRLVRQVRSLDKLQQKAR
ncbi:hypothetical protein BJ742DRAFT_307282 [Cladochytrium replicatum]|nr:hypothetical protein BJ742DRAFT_307282 [Cladochytrium replicatum]